MSVQDRIVSGGGVEVVVSAMRRFPGRLALQKIGCQTLACLASTVDHKAAVARDGGLAAIVQAMNAHPTAVALQDHGIRALGSFSVHDSNKVSLGYLFDPRACPLLFQLL